MRNQGSRHEHYPRFCVDVSGKGSIVDPGGAGSGKDRVLRGGCWADPAERCRAAMRYMDELDDRIDVFGFRLIRIPAQ